MFPQQNPQQGTPVNTNDQVLKGSYSNAMQVTHTQEEFVLDFFGAFPPVTTLNTRVVVSPGHLKRMIAVLTQNLANYEKAYGSIKQASEPGEIGFNTNK